MRFPIPESAPPERRVECSLERAKWRRWRARGVEAGLHARAESSQRKTLSPVRCNSSVVLYTVSKLHSFGAVAAGISWTSRQEERCVVDAPLVWTSPQRRRPPYFSTSVFSTWRCLAPVTAGPRAPLQLGLSRLALPPLPTHRAAASRPLECDAVDANAALDNITRMPGKCGASVPWA